MLNEKESELPYKHKVGDVDCYKCDGMLYIDIDPPIPCPKCNNGLLHHEQVIYEEEHGIDTQHLIFCDNEACKFTKEVWNIKNMKDWNDLFQEDYRIFQG
jgi:hypothetical protein